MSTEQKTVWYRNTEFDTFHEVLVGTDTEKRMRGEQRSVEDEDGDETFEKAFEKVNAKDVPAAEDQAGYPPEHVRAEHAAAAAAAAPKLTEADVDKRVQDALDSFIAAQAAAAEKAPAKPAPVKAGQ